jgi:hypothetical protein
MGPARWDLVPARANAGLSGRERAKAWGCTLHVHRLWCLVCRHFYIEVHCQISIRLFFELIIRLGYIVVNVVIAIYHIALYVTVIAIIQFGFSQSIAFPQSCIRWYRKLCTY